MTQKAFNLRQYAALSAGFLAAGHAGAQTGYHEFDPYFPMTFNEDVVVDLDMDGEDDFGFFFRKEWSVSTGYGVNDFTFNMEQFGANEVVVAPLAADQSFTIYSDTCYFPAATGVDKIGSLVAIGPDDEWDVAEIMARGESCTSYAFIKQGDWLFSGGQQDKFVGFRLSKPELYYGWMRIRHNDSGNIDYIKDYYISPTPNTEVVTPEVEDMYAPAPEEITLFYAGDDLMVTFPKASDESALEEYRVILRDASFTSALTSEICDITVPENYVSVPKTGTDTYTTNVSALTHYWSGVPMASGDSIKAYVYTKYLYPYTMLNGMSPASAAVYYEGASTIADTPSPIMHAWFSGAQLIVQTNGLSLEEILLYDISGRRLAIEPVNNDQVQYTYAIPVNLPRGVYIVVVHDSAEAAYARKVVQL